MSESSAQWPIGHYVIVRCKNAGVFAGTLTRLKGKDENTAEMKGARRLWYWSGAASLSQLAMEGVKNPDQCKFPIEVDHEIVFETIEILKVSEEARKSIADVPVWKSVIA